MPCENVCRFGSVAVATVLAVAVATSVSADEVASATTTVTSTTAIPTRSTTEAKEVAIPDYWRLRKQMRDTGLEVTETEAKTQADEKTADQDYAKQAIAIDKTVAEYKAEVAANQEIYEKEKAVVDAKMQHLRQPMIKMLKRITKSRQLMKKQSLKMLQP